MNDLGSVICRNFDTRSARSSLLNWERVYNARSASRRVEIQGLRMKLLIRNINPWRGDVRVLIYFEDLNLRVIYRWTILNVLWLRRCLNDNDLSRIIHLIRYCPGLRRYTIYRGLGEILWICIVIGNLSFRIRNEHLSAAVVDNFRLLDWLLGLSMRNDRNELKLWFIVIGDILRSLIVHS